MPQPAMNESRFYMWRAVFALAHADGVVTQQERDFIEGYIGRLPLSDEQKEIMRADLQTPQSINEMLIGVRDKNDHADFFQFAQMIIWCDGDQAEQEKAIIDRLMSEQMNKFNKAEIAEGLRQGRMAAELRRSLEDEEFKKQAANTGLFAGWRRGSEYRGNANSIAKNALKELGRGLADTLGIKTSAADDQEQSGVASALGWMRQQAFHPPTQEVFALWRAVFSLVNADGKITPEEQDYIDGMMQIFRFTPEQKETVAADLRSPNNIVPLFRALKTTELRRQYFIAARTVIWCDWEFSDQEREMMESLVILLDPAEKTALAADIDWIKKQTPPAPSDDAPPPAAKGLFSQMVGFYNKTAHS